MTERPGHARTLLRPRPQVSFTGSRFLMFELDEMAAEYEKQYDDVIRLTLGKSELPPDDAVVGAMLDAAADYRKAGRVHPAGLPELRERLAMEYERQYATAIAADRFVISTGTSTLLRNVYQLLAGPGDEIVVPLPYYPLYVFPAQLIGATIRHYRLDPVTLRVDLDSLREAITDRTRIVVVNSPGNPLGNVIGPAEFRELDSVVNGRAVLISDEIYGNVQFDDPPFSAVQYMDELTCPLIVTNAFSKAHAMYARRVGYGIVPAELVEPLTVIQHHTLLTADPVSQFGAIAALDNQEGVRALTDRYRARRDYTVQRLAVVPDVTVLPSRGGFYVTLDCTDHMRRRAMSSSLDLAQSLMRTIRVATVPGSDFGLPHTLRLSFSAARYDEAVDRLAACFAGDHG